MERNWKRAAGAAAILLFTTSGALAAGPAHPAHRGGAAASAASHNLARLGGHPNINGIWEVMNTANWDLAPHDAAQAPVALVQLGAIGAVPGGVGVVEGGAIPWKPDAVKQRDQNHAAAPK